MIGLQNLPDGGHVLEHPDGSVYVLVRRRKVVHAQLAPWGDPGLVKWPRPHFLTPAQALTKWQRRLAEGVVANV